MKTDYPDVIFVWNTMHHMFFPCRAELAKIGHAFEDAKDRYENFANQNKLALDDKNKRNIRKVLVREMNETFRLLSPHLNEWYRIKYGISLN